LKHRPLRFVVVGAAMIAATGVLAAPAVASSLHAVHNGTIRSFSVVRGSLTKTTDVSIGAFHSDNMSVEVTLAPSHEAQLQSLLASVYNPKSTSYQHWLKKGQFDSRFAPSRRKSRL
jgi:subtilase family serine protease